MTDEAYEREERAAILEYDAGYSRDEAERIAGIVPVVFIEQLDLYDLTDNRKKH